MSLCRFVSSAKKEAVVAADTSPRVKAKQTKDPFFNETSAL
jgi:hypothetical protein